MHGFLSKMSYHRWALAFLCASPLYAKNFGHMGHTFPIEEKDMLLMISSQLSKPSSIQSSKNYPSLLLEKIKHLPSLPNIPSATIKRSFYHTPSYLVPETLTDTKGRIIASKGTSIAPLQEIKLSTSLLFIDGENLSHITWARRQGDHYKWILVGGSPFACEQKEKKSVYFDFYGHYAKKLQIHNFPARVIQEGLRLKIEEIPIDTHGEEL